MYHDPKIYPPDPVTEPVGDLTWSDKKHPCNGPLHWRWHVAMFLMRVEDFAGSLSERANDLRRSIDPIEGTKAEERKAAIRRATLDDFITEQARAGEPWAIERAGVLGLPV